MERGRSLSRPLHQQHYYRPRGCEAGEYQACEGRYHPGPHRGPVLLVLRADLVAVLPVLRADSQELLAGSFMFLPVLGTDSLPVLDVLFADSLAVLLVFPSDSFEVLFVLFLHRVEVFALLGEQPRDEADQTGGLVLGKVVLCEVGDHPGVFVETRLHGQYTPARGWV